MDVTVENQVEVTNTSTLDIEAGGIVEVEQCSTADLEVTVQPKEYKIVGDGLYIPSRYEDAPGWLQNLIDQTVQTSIALEKNDLNNVVESLNSMLTELEIAKNTYTQSVISSNDIDQRINTAIATLNSSLAAADANILNIAQTATTPEEASALAIEAINAELSNTDVGTLGAQISELASAIVEGDNAVATSVETLSSALEGEVNARASAVNTINAYVGIDNAGASTGTGLSAYLEGADGTIGGAESRVANNVYVDSDGQTRSTFEYQSLLNINGQYYNSGFGLVTSNSSGSGTKTDPYNSEFWINAEKFKFTNSNQTGQATPFTIDATGTQPKITFNGLVTFGSGQTGTIEEAITSTAEAISLASTDYVDNALSNIDVSQDIADNNDVFAQRLGYGSYDQLVAAATAGNTVINGGYLNTGLIEAQAITADLVDTTDLVAKHIDVDNNIGFKLQSGASGTTNDPHIEGGYIKGGTIEGTHIQGTTFSIGDIRVQSESDPTKTGLVTYVTKNGIIYGKDYGAGHENGRVCSDDSTIVVDASIQWSGYDSGYENTLGASVALEYSIDGGSSWVTLDTKSSLIDTYIFGNSGGGQTDNDGVIYFKDIIPTYVLPDTGTLRCRLRVISAPHTSTSAPNYILTVYNQ